MAEGKKLCDRIADIDVIKRHKARGLKIRDANTELFDVESIVFREIDKAPWFDSLDQTADHIVGMVEFHSNGRCFYTSATGLPNYRQTLKEKGNEDSGKKYIVSVSTSELCKIYDDSKKLK